MYRDKPRASLYSERDNYEVKLSKMKKKRTQTIFHTTSTKNNN